MLSHTTVLLLAFTFLYSFAFGQGDLVAELDYGTFAGAYSTDYNISYWMKVPFAAPPTGQNRFRAPQPPIPITNGTYNSTQSFDFCPQRTVNGTEDCLYLGLYGRPWTKEQPLRPVVVVYFGGAYIEGGGSLVIPPSGYPVLNASDSNDFIFVYPNYRVNAFGFLPGREIAEDAHSNLNPGLLDQQAALIWTHRYIENFGGNPNNVSIWGQSAGAGSVVAQVIANGGHTQPKLFSKALASSPFWEKTYRYDAPQAQQVYDSLANLTGCAGPTSLQCLKTVDVQTIRTAALQISYSQTYNTSSYTWAPVIDGTFLPQPLSKAIARGDVNSDYGFGMYNLNEGENFIPPGLQNANNTSQTTDGFTSPPYNSSVSSFDMWLRGYLPGLTQRNLATVKALYPESGTAEELTYNTTYVRAGLIYRDTTLACPSLWMAETSHKRSYLGEYTIPPATHGADTEWWDQVTAIQQEDSVIYHGFAGAFASFFQTGDPNAHKLTNASQPGVPEIQETGEEFVIKDSGFANVPFQMLRSRCDFWLSVADEIPI